MEHSFRASTIGREDFNIDASLAQNVEPMVTALSGPRGIGWLSTGPWEKRNSWSDLEWCRFTKTMRAIVAIAFPPDKMNVSERELLAAYMQSYGIRHRSGVPSKEVSLLLQRMKKKLGDPQITCDVCNTFATGSKMSRCGKCKDDDIQYCGKECQMKGWKTGHAKYCIPCATDRRNLPGEFLWTGCANV